MPEHLSNKLREYLSISQGKIVDLRDIRTYFQIEPGSKDDSNLRNLMSTTLVREKTVTPSGYNDGRYKVIKQVKPVQVFGQERQRRAPFELFFPLNWTTEMELDFAEHIVFRAGDLITIGGVKSMGKTTLALGLCAANIDKYPVLMGNEYTILSEDSYEPAPRFLDRLDRMREYTQWTNGSGMDKFILLPVREDYREHIVSGRINIIDWINLDGDKAYDIGKILEGIKHAVGLGIGVAIIQKSELAVNPRGGQFVRDFSDLELTLDQFGSNPYDGLLTVRGCKESTSPIVGKTYAYTIGDGGTKIFNFREVRKCRGCSGSGLIKGHPCDECLGTKYTDV